MYLGVLKYRVFQLCCVGLLTVFQCGINFFSAPVLLDKLRSRSDVGCQQWITAHLLREAERGPGCQDSQAGLIYLLLFQW